MITKLKERNLEQVRKFYLVYGKSQLSESMSNEEKTQTVSAELINEKSETVSRIFNKLNFQLSWSHYLLLMRIENPDERKFYEREAIENNWSLRELKRKFNSALYERLVLSRDKKIY